MTNLNYLAYGSNLHPLRLQERVPSARLTGVVELPGYCLTFNKRSTDSSGKCNLLCSGDESSSTHAVIYKIDSQEKRLLDEVEGVGNGYLDAQIAVILDEIEYSCFTYFAQDSHVDTDLKPYHWYKALVLAGAEYHNFPGAYLQSIVLIQSQQDPDLQRRRTREALLQRMRQYQ